MFTFQFWILRYFYSSFSMFFYYLSSKNKSWLNRNLIFGISMLQKCMDDKIWKITGSWYIVICNAILSNNFLNIPSILFKRSKIKTLIVIKHTNHLVKKTMQYKKFYYYMYFVFVWTKEMTWMFSYLTATKN